MSESSRAVPPPASAGPSLLIVTTVASTIRSFLLPYADHLRRRGWRVEAAASGIDANGVLSQHFDAVHDEPLSRSLRDVRQILAARRALAGVVASGAYDIVHVHTPIASFLTRAVVRRLPAGERPALAYTAHGFHFHADGASLTNRAFLTAEQVAGRWTDRLVVINDEDEAAARRHRVVPASRLVRMPGIGIDTDHFAPGAVDRDAVEAVRADLGVSAETPLFVLVGEFSRNKRHRDVIDALAQMRDQAAKVVFAGEGPGRPAVEAYAQERGVEARIVFAGFVRDVRPLIRASIALLLPSRREGLARSVMEALSLEVPAIVSSARGNRELVGGDAGFVERTGDVAAIAARMDWLIEHPTMARLMGERGRERMRERFALEHVIALHDELYDGMLREAHDRRQDGRDRAGSASR